MDAKVTVTSRCNAKCKTCPVHEYKGKDMTLENFKKVYDRLQKLSGLRIMLNNTGDMYIHPDRHAMFDYIEQNPGPNPVIMTTNAGAMDRVPKINEVVISFNGGDKESYERTTGLNFEETVDRIKGFYPELSALPALQMHCLIWQGNQGCEESFKELWADFPGKLRFSYKYDNQMKDDKCVQGASRNERFLCDYLTNMSITPSGKMISCAHDFEEVTDFGNFITDSLEDILNNAERQRKIKEHMAGVFSGLCEKCNYNTPTDGRIVTVKG